MVSPPIIDELMLGNHSDRYTAIRNSAGRCRTPPKKMQSIDKLWEAKSAYEDGDGLRLLIKPNGKKYWVLLFQLVGKRREMGLGTYPAVGLKEARQNSSDKRRLLRDGIDPLQARDDERTAQQAAEHHRIQKS